jgi:hypothetical protein
MEFSPAEQHAINWAKGKCTLMVSLQILEIGPRSKDKLSLELTVMSALGQKQTFGKVRFLALSKVDLPVWT